MSQSNFVLKPDEIVFDPTTGEYINKNSGLVLLPDELPESKVSHLSIKKATPPTVDEFFDHLLDEFTEGLSRARSNDWSRIVKYPEMKIGQTKPYTDDVTFETVTLHQNGVTDVYEIRRGQRKYVKTIHHAPIIQEMAPSQRVPDCVDMESSEKGFPTEPVDIAGFCESMVTLLRRIKENPEGKWINLLGLMVDFLVDGISFNQENREYGIPELLSVFERLKKERSKTSEQNRLLILKDKELSHKLKHLRDQFYGNNRRNTNFHMK